MSKLPLGYLAGRFYGLHLALHSCCARRLPCGEPAAERGGRAVFDGVSFAAEAGTLLPALAVTLKITGTVETPLPGLMKMVVVPVVLIKLVLFKVSMKF